jgi:site-specific DNA-cytosine methylase
MNYYNEWDSFAADWLRELIKDGLIPDGEVDNRSIADVRPEDLKEFTQCHFFAGIGGWSQSACSSQDGVQTDQFGLEALPASHFLQPGKEKEKDDERHLWPVFFNLIRECQPPTVFGEQVAAAIRYGWLDDLQTDFEREGYASAAAFVLPAGGIGAPHKRERLFFVADSHNERHEWSQEAGREARSGVEHTGSVSMADTKSGRHKQSEQFSNGCSSQSDKRQSDSSGNCESQRQLMADSCGERCGGKEWGGEAEEKGQSERYSFRTQRRRFRGQRRSTIGSLTQQVSGLTPWATPNTMDHMKQRSDEALARAKQKAGCSNLKDQIPYSGEAQKSSTAETENIAPSQLNPRFSLWLMGYPIEWAYCAERVTPLSRKRQRKS